MSHRRVGAWRVLAIVVARCDDEDQKVGATCFHGAAGSKLEKALGDQFPEGERYFGLKNFGNTCYCNSTL